MSKKSVGFDMMGVLNVVWTEESMREKEELTELMAELHAQDYDVGVITTAKYAGVSAIMSRFPAESFDFIVNNASKRTTEGFDAIAEALNKNKSDIVLVDDTIDNVDCANRAGMTGLLYTNPQNLRNDMEKLGLIRPKP